ncbi:multicopper oxidase family protein [Pannonibacter phragmitetus]|uniref:multicopper oxidase family protein n=1 Tax=Pannonibacter phragmitetus TaxID=121719 RepID=UPI001FFDBFB6|nr:multicopper oxidase domain-containing protein [Pannonibacter phragmitetus]
MEIGPGAGNTLDAIRGTRDFIAGAASETWGYSQDYLGPLLRFRRGRTANISVTNRLDEPITAHWHGMHVPGYLDGGPQLAFGPGETWAPELPVDHPAATLFYHSHVHGRTGPQVYRGLAGMIVIDDPEIDDPLPHDYGVNDFPLIVQDRRFDRSGRVTYSLGMMDRMHGFQADQILVNGVIRPKLTVPAGLVRLRILNASNARVYDFRFTDGRQFHQVASDGGLLDRPLAMASLQLNGAERAEIVADFSDRSPVSLASRDIGMGGMMNEGTMGDRGGSMMKGDRGMMGDRGRMGDRGMMGMGGNSGAPIEIMSFDVGAAAPAGPTRLPTSLPSDAPALGDPVRRRNFTLNMHTGGMMRGGMMGGDGQTMGINGEPYVMDRIDETIRAGETELWRISTDMMMRHTFHVHGTSFRVVSQNGRPVDSARIGWKDVVRVQGSTEILLRFDKLASEETPFMYHCHILEHEDAGMMGQFTVT